MSVDDGSFKHALAQFASGVTVVVTQDGSGRRLGLTVSSFCSVSLAPPLVLVCVDARSETHTGFRESGRFAVSVLAEGQEDVSVRFARGGPEKFEGMPLEPGRFGIGLVPGALAHIECRVVGAHGAGDHTIYVGEVEAVSVTPGPPLVYQRGAYRRLQGGAA